MATAPGSRTNYTVTLVITTDDCRYTVNFNHPRLLMREGKFLLDKATNRGGALMLSYDGVRVDKQPKEEN